MVKKYLTLQTAFEFVDDRFVDEFCRESPIGALPPDSAKRLLAGEEIEVKIGKTTTKIRIYDQRLAKKRYH